MAKNTLPIDNFDTEIVPADIGTALKHSEAVVHDGSITIDPKNLFVMPNYNMRVHGKRYKERVAYLKKSMLQLGYDMTEPITVFAAMIGDDPRLVVQDGHHRIDAALEAGVKELSIVIKPAETTAKDLQYALILKNAGEPPAPYEAAVVVKRLVNQGESKKDIAKNLSVTTRYVDDLLVLADAPGEVIDAVVNEQVSATQAIEELRAYEPEEVVKRMLKGLKKAASEGKTKVTKRMLADDSAKGKKNVKARRPSKAEPETVPQNAVADFMATFDELYGENDKASYEISFDSTIGHVATLLDGPNDDEGTKEIGQGIGATIQHACLACVKDFKAKAIAAAAEDL